MTGQIRVLVIDDDSVARMVVEYALVAGGFEVYTAESGSLGIKVAREKQPDVILLDWMMPRLDGMGVLSDLKSHESTRELAVFMLTAKTSEGDMIEAFDKGVDAYIVKPFNAARLAQTVRQKFEEYLKNKAADAERVNAS